MQQVMRKTLSSLVRFLPVITAIASLVCAATPLPSAACSAFSLHNSDVTLSGKNLDWDDPLPGHVIVNKRGVKKDILPWRGWWPDAPRAKTVSWVSRYGSITFSAFGRDFIEGGMNEKGLTVNETSLIAVYAPDDGRPGVSCSQWMQYQLDNFSTVEEVLAHLDDLRMDGEEWHFLISDAAGESAVIEYPNGKPSVYAGDGLDIPALTNADYETSMSQVSKDIVFGGDVDIADGSDSYARFTRIAAMMRDFDPTRGGEGVEYAFGILDAVKCGDTLRSVVYDAGNGRVAWTTKGNSSRRWLEFKNIDFSLTTPTQSIDVESGGAGDVTELLKPFTLETNRSIVEAVRAGARRDRSVIQELESRGLTVDEALEMISNNPKDPDGGD